MDSVLTFLQIVLINLLLSGDNAVVIAMASQQLPPKERKRAVWWGALAAVGLRCLLTLAAISLLQIPYLQAIGSLLLLYIAAKLLSDAGQEGEGDLHMPSRKSKSLSQAVRTIVAADFIMSLDNVLAIAAVADGDTVLILLGIALSIPMIIWGSQILGTLLHKFPPLVYIGAGLLGYAAGGMLVHDPGMDALLFNGSRTAAEAIPLLCIPFVVIIGLLKRRT
ncbi:TerC family protein [Paenibacillus sp. JDR-2]|uniref:TerC family protein n=1 Tax=Paenibacillus sp. (strain JDR-2) TaxID=324057 RepID=UPI0001663D92|nr:TerC family protein [Paenibacillus sp. JDR-2]ACT02550.1 Integral membrane protein TerC [Paenibacillus sp. JDR-2]